MKIYQIQFQKLFLYLLVTKDDEKLSKNGYSVTISCHTKALFWDELSNDEYENKKEITKNFILNELFKNFEDIKKRISKQIFVPLVRPLKDI